MNLLAHLHLGQELDPVAAAGNLTADYCPTAGSDEFLTGIWFHRSIDAFTDHHPLVTEARSLFPSELRRFAGILCDLAFDLCLSRTWEEWEECSRDRFIDEHLTRILEADELPSGSAEIVQRGHDERWLHAYAKIEGIGLAIERISLRRPVFSKMIGAEKHIGRIYPELEQQFRLFYPQLRAHI
ncbi:MAG: ACP phosphodiesterase [Limisphaerales bacterium]